MRNCSVLARPSKAPTVVGQRYLPIRVHGRLGQLGEIHLENSRQLHEAPNAYQLAPERTVVQKACMSHYQYNLLGARKAPTKNEKVVSNFGDKRRYVLHYRNLQLRMSLEESHLELSKRPAQAHEQQRLWKDHGKSPQVGGR